jgi:hypothetical protein
MGLEKTMKACSFLTFATLVLWAAGAAAVSDPSPDHIGIYFDRNADNWGISMAPSVPFSAYVVITNPTQSTISGAAFQYRVRVPEGLEGLIFRLNEIRNPADVSCGVGCLPTDPLEDFYVMVFEPALPAAPAVVVMEWQFMLLASMSVELFLGPIDPVDFEGESPSYESGGVATLLGPVFGSWDVPLGYVNITPPLAVESASFGSVKALFR